MSSTLDTITSSVANLNVQENTTTTTTIPTVEERFKDKLTSDVLDFIVAGPDGLNDLLPETEVWENLPLKPDLIKGCRNNGWEKPSPPQGWMLPYMLHPYV